MRIKCKNSRYERELPDTAATNKDGGSETVNAACGAEYCPKDHHEFVVL